MALSVAVCNLLHSRNINPSSIIEPTCGKGNFVLASLRIFDSASKIVCLEYNHEYVYELKQRLTCEPGSDKIDVSQGDFFKHDWAKVLTSIPEPILIIGNPPWVTNAVLGKINGTNLPQKSNFQGHKGFDALTGKSNFDISEWMLIHLLEWASSKQATIAFLCKTAVARKVIKHRWKNGLGSYDFSVYKLDAFRHFGASVDACLFIAEASNYARSKVCPVYCGIERPELERQIGIRGNALVSDLDKFSRTHDLVGKSAYVWRSGIKHDCSAVMELKHSKKGTLRNKLGESINIEDDFLYPLLKSSDIAKGDTDPRLSILVTQRTPGQDTSQIQSAAPRTWQYLTSHAERLDARGSSVYRNKPPFSIFGVGTYSFSPWKVAISGLYKRLQFTAVGPVNGKPVMLDDTCYFISCESEAEAMLLESILRDKRASDFYSSFIFWDEKRPITVELLRKLDLLELAKQIGVDTQYMHHVAYNPNTDSQKKQLFLIREEM